MACNLYITLCNNSGGQQQRITLGLAWGARRTYRGRTEELVGIAHGLIKILLLHDHISEAAQSSGKQATHFLPACPGALMAGGAGLLTPAGMPSIVRCQDFSICLKAAFSFELCGSCMLCSAHHCCAPLSSSMAARHTLRSELSRLRSSKACEDSRA